MIDSLDTAMTRTGTILGMWSITTRRGYSNVSMPILIYIRPSLATHSPAGSSQRRSTTTHQSPSSNPQTRSLTVKSPLNALILPLPHSLCNTTIAPISPSITVFNHGCSDNKIVT